MIKYFLLLTFFTSCIFVPETPEEPLAEYRDQLSLNQIMNGTGYSFVYGGYDELFVNTNSDYDVFTDFDGFDFARSRFIGRLNSIVSQYGDSVTVSWENDGSGDFLSENDGFEKILGVRNYRVTTPDGIFEGQVEIRVRYDKVFKWQILYWKEIENKYEGANIRYSIFHPDFGS